MRRVSVSSHEFSGGGPSLQIWQWRPLFSFLVCVCAVVMWVTGSISVASFAADEDSSDGSLELNTDVIVNESVGLGTAGDFEIRGRLFSDELSVRTQALREIADERLSVVDALSFEPRGNEAVEQHRILRSGLFESYTPKVLHAASHTDEDFSLLHGLGLVAAVPIVLVTGVLLGRFWAGRKRVSS